MPGTDETFLIRPSRGTTLVLAGGIFVLALGMAGCIKDMFSGGFSIWLFMVFAALVWVSAILGMFAFCQKMEISGGMLFTSAMLPEMKLFYMPERDAIALADIAQVTVATRQYFEAHEREFRNDSLAHAIEVYRNLRTRRRGSLERETRKTPIMFVAAKPDRGGSFAVAVEPFDETDFARLIAELSGRGVKVFTEPSLKMQPA